MKVRLTHRRRFLPTHRFLRAALVLLGILLMMLGAFRFYTVRLQPLVIQAASYTVTDALLLKINDIVRQQISAGAFEYDRLVTVEKDNQGNITALIMNAGAANMIQAQIANMLVESISDNYISELKIPLGTLMNSSLFYGRGPCIPIRLKSVTNVSARLENDFSSAGINQTRHRIYLNVSVSICVLIPGQEIEAPVSTDVVIAETVIVGRVPEIYAEYGG